MMSQEQEGAGDEGTDALVSRQKIDLTQDQVEQSDSLLDEELDDTDLLDASIDPYDFRT